ncbi:hypothetical protein K501DRAFT_200685 [Backusella circina FSU 941]|nr:hypothetical protein K501DRAFT_200685 [Backusella circina FSU 941]
MEDINKAANVLSVIHMDRPDEPSTEPSTEPLAVLASFIPGTELTNRIINTTIWTTNQYYHTSMTKANFTIMYIKGQKVLLLTKNFYQV